MRYGHQASCTPAYRDGLPGQRAAEASHDQAAAQYRSTVLTAFQNVADTLHAIDADAQSLRAAAEQAAHNSWSIALIRARANRYADTVALFQALGGGWQSQQSER